jgi:hypothetical protein
MIARGGEDPVIDKLDGRKKEKPNHRNLHIRKWIYLMLPIVMSRNGWPSQHLYTCSHPINCL